MQGSRSLAPRWTWQEATKSGNAMRVCDGSCRRLEGICRHNALHSKLIATLEKQASLCTQTGQDELAKLLMQAAQALQDTASRCVPTFRTD